MFSTAVQCLLNLTYIKDSHGGRDEAGRHPFTLGLEQRLQIPWHRLLPTRLQVIHHIRLIHLEDLDDPYTFQHARGLGVFRERLCHARGDDWVDQE